MRWSWLLQAPHKGDHLEHVVLRHAAPGEGLHRARGASVEDLEHADVGRGALMFPLVPDQRRPNSPGAIRQVASLAIGLVKLLALANCRLVSHIGVLARFLEALDGLGLDLVRPRLDLERRVVEHVPEHDRLRDRGAPDGWKSKAERDHPKPARHRHSRSFTTKRIGARGRLGRSGPARRSYFATTFATSAPLGTLSAGTTRQSAPAGLAVGPLSSV